MAMMNTLISTVSAMDVGEQDLTVPGLLRWRASRSPQETAVQYHEGRAWKTLTYEEYCTLVWRLRDRLRATGLNRGDRVALFADTCFEWALVDLAVQSFGGVVVAIHPAYSSDEVLHALRASAPVTLFYGGEKPTQALQRVLGAYERKLTVYGLHDCPTGAPSLWTLLRQRGVDAKAAPRSEVKGTDLATIVFTSGTAGMPKAVCLTQNNLVATAEASVEHLAFRLPALRTLHWLPFAHLFGRIGLYLDLVTGAHATYARGLEHVAEDLRLARPHVLFTVPKALARFRQGILRQIDSQPRWKRALVHRLVAAAAKPREQSLLRRRIPGADRLLKRAMTVLRRQVVGAFGGNLQLVVVGSAPVSPETFDLFETLGIAVREGYGMTETSGVACVNPYGAAQRGTVGSAIRTIEVKIAGDQELLVRGPSVFQGYLDGQQNLAAFTPDGWFRTGDLGEQMADGYVRIVGRKKDIIITDGGENVTPERLETALAAQPFIKDAVVIGDRRPYLVAVLNVDGARESSETPAESAHRALTSVNRTLAAFERIRQFVIAQEDFSVDNGELTTSFKKRRRVIEERYRSQIDALYSQAGQYSA
jgi:long-chain acyl-CoA synthetase